MKKILRGDRYEIIRGLVNGKTVLDIGCVDHNFEDALKQKGDEWLHGFICKYAKRCIGLDVEKEELKKLTSRGYACIYANAENFTLSDKFDVIVAGEVIEHMYNVGNFLTCVKKHLKKGGKLVLTTPNPYCFKYILQVMFFGKPKIREDHTCMFDPQTLSYLLSRHGFNVDNIYWINFSNKKYKVGHWLSYIDYIHANFLVIASMGAINDG